jgi:hypothetical protein
MPREDHDAQPTQKTEKGYEIPVPGTADVARVFEKVAKTPDPDVWQRQVSPAPGLRECPHCRDQTWHNPYTPIVRRIGPLTVTWFCRDCGANNGAG